MAITLVNNVAAGAGAGGDTVTTASIDTSG